MSSENEESKLFTTGQLAELLGCNIRSIYRWEQSGVIPAPSRVERGGVQARVYTAAEVEHIRKAVQDRISFTATVRQGAPKRRISPVPRDRRPVVVPKATTKRRKRTSGRPVQKVKVPRTLPVSSTEVFEVSVEYASQFIGAVRFAQKHGCLALTVTAPDGKTRTFTQASDTGPKL